MDYIIQTPCMLADLIERYDVTYCLKDYVLNNDATELEGCLREALDCCLDDYEEAGYLYNLISGYPYDCVLTDIVMRSLKAHSRRLNQRVLLYRGFNPSSVVNRIGMPVDSLSGRTINMPGLVSTSTSVYEAIEYASNSNGLSLDDGWGVLLQINVNKPFSYLDIANMRGYGHTDEHGELMFMNIRFRIGRLLQITDNVYVYEATMI